MTFKDGVIPNAFKIKSTQEYNDNVPELSEINTNVITPGLKNSELKVFSSKHTVFIDNPS